jgi:putative heme-binding domain-containing protein
MVDVGPGSPVGVTFGYGAKFPARYQKALFICDWTFGTMYALHRTPEGSTYTAEKEEFLSRTPLPLTDNAVGPDGALYFTVGGRGTQSELYRVTYTGTEPTTPVDPAEPRNADLRELRRTIEADHHKAADQAGAVAHDYPYLGHPDRFIRYAARVALENQDVALWQDRVLAETNPEALITGAVGLARQGDKALEGKLLAALDRLDFGALTEPQKLELLRAWSLVFIRMGEPESETGALLAKKLDAYYPANSDALNRQLCIVLVYLKSPTVVTKTLALMRQEAGSVSGPEAELLARNPGYGGSIAKMLASRPDLQKLHYAFVLRNAKQGWTLDQRRFYFQWLRDARQKWSGGASFQGFLNNMDNDAFENASEQERLAVEATGARQPFRAKELPRPQGPGHAWTVDELTSLAGTKLKGRNFQNGLRTFAAARCVVCHRFGGDGGATGPDLTQAAGRFGVKDLAEAIVMPSKVVSDQYRASIVATTSGQVVTGRIVNENDKSLVIVVDPEDSTKVTEVPKNQVEGMKPSATSLMPENLLGSLNENEVLDLLAYLLSRGNEKDPIFRK